MGFIQSPHFYYYSPVEGSALVELFIFQSFQIFQILHNQIMIWGRRTTAFQRIPARAPEDDTCENLGGGQTECILHGALLC